MSDEQSTTPPQDNGAPPSRSVQERIVEHVKANKIDCFLWATRMLTIIFAIGYLIPIFG